MLAAGIVLLLSTVASAWLLARALARPVRAIAAAARRIHDLELEPGPPLAPSRIRELDDAARAFNAMREGLSGFQTYLPKSLVQRLLQRGHIENVRSEEREITVLFTDISDFSGFAENLPADGVAAFLNRHFTLLVKCVEEEGGTVDKYVGDSLMAFWGAPDHQPDHAERAFGAALDMALAVRRENAARAAAGLEPIRIRIGLHSGPAVVGNIGAPGRVNYTVVGDTVNVARRMESLSKSLAGDRQEAIILVSSFTIQHLGLGLESFSIGAHSLKGRDGPIEVFRLA
jgi:class 3 adenylate cyclase